MQVAFKPSPLSARPFSSRARRPGRAWLVWGFAAGLYFVAVFHRMVLGVAALEAERRYHVGPGALSAFTAIQLGVYLAMQVPVGLAADRIGPRRSLAAGMTAIAAGEAIFALTGTFGAGLAGRALIGLGDAFVFVNVLRVAHTWFEPSRAALLTALTSLLGALGQLLTTIPAHLALDGLGWTTTFAGAAAITAVLAAGALGVVRDAPAARAASGDQPAPAPPAQDAVLATLRAAWSGRRTRMGFWAHFGLMTPFVTMTALWGYPWLVQAQGIPRSTAATWLASSIVALPAPAPFVGRPGERGPAVQVRRGRGAGEAGAAGAGHRHLARPRLGGRARLARRPPAARADPRRAGDQRRRQRGVGRRVHARPRGRPGARGGERAGPGQLRRLPRRLARDPGRRRRAEP